MKYVPPTPDLHPATRRRRSWKWDVCMWLLAAGLMVAALMSGG